MPKTTRCIYNHLSPNGLPPLIGEGELKCFTYSKHLTKLLQRFVRINVPNQDENGRSPCQRATTGSIAELGSKLEKAQLQIIKASRLKSIDVEPRLRENKRN